MRRTLAANSVARSGFTLVEMLGSVLIIFLLVGLLIAGVRGALIAARQNNDEAVIKALSFAITAFESEMGFVPPLVHDGASMGDASTSPVGYVAYTSISSATAIGNPEPVRQIDGTTKVAPVTYSPLPNDDLPFFRGASLAFTTSERDLRYSKLSLSYYLAGALGQSVDGVDGLGMLAVDERTGAFGFDSATGASNIRKQYEAFYEPKSDEGAGSLKRGYLDDAEYLANTGSAAPAGLGAPALAAADRYLVAIVDRQGKAFRYYRWEHDASVTDLGSLNIPEMVLRSLAQSASADLASAAQYEALVESVAASDADLKGARWAIVSAGEDGDFGGPGNWEAALDNVVGVGN